MAWTPVEITIGKKVCPAWQRKKTGEFSLLYVKGIKKGDAFQANNISYVVKSIVNIGGRNEELLIGGKEVKIDKSKARGS